MTLNWIAHTMQEVKIETLETKTETLETKSEAIEIDEPK